MPQLRRPQLGLIEDVQSAQVPAAAARVAEKRLSPALA